MIILSINARRGYMLSVSNTTFLDSCSCNSGTWSLDCSSYNCIVIPGEFCLGLFEFCLTGCQHNFSRYFLFFLIKEATLVLQEYAVHVRLVLVKNSSKQIVLFKKEIYFRFRCKFLSRERTLATIANLLEKHEFSCNYISLLVTT